jgi:beta-carotene hydroxylase
MLPRFREDYRSLFWAFVLFPSVPLIALLDPSLAPWLLVPSLYLAYCAGVLAHNHNHCPTFRGARANAFYSAWLSVFYGCPLFVWIPTHNRNHHRYLNGEGDATRTTRHSAKNTLFSALTYPLASSRWQWPAIASYVRDARRDSPRRFRSVVLESAALAVAQLGLLALAIALHGPGVGGLTYALAAGVPALLSPSFMMFTNYVQHVDCDPASPDDHSRNFVSPLWNWFVFDAGYHTVHHEHPGTHWSRYAALHRERASRIDPRLNQPSVFAYCFSSYVLGAFRRGTERTPPAATLP